MADRAALRLLLVAVLMFGGAWPITKHALLDSTPLWFATSRAGLAALVAALVLAALGRLHLPRPGDWRAVVFLGLFQLGSFFALTHLALDYVPSGRTALLSNVLLFWLIPLSVFVLGEKVSRARWVAAGLGLAGAVVLIGPWAVDWSDHAMLGGHAMLLAAGLLWSIAIVATRLWPPRSLMLELLPWCFGLGALFLAPFALWLEPGGGIGVAAWPHMLFIGMVAAPIGTWCVIEAGRRLPGAVASVGFLLVPAFGVTLGTVWLGEPVGWDVILGGALIVSSVMLAARK